MRASLVAALLTAVLLGIEVVPGLRRQVRGDDGDGGPSLIVVVILIIILVLISLDAF